MAKNIEERIVFAISLDGQGDGVPILILGVPAGAWEFIKDGKTNTFDLTSIGVPLKLMVFGAATHAEAMKVLEKSCFDRGAVAMENRMNQDFAMKPKE